MELVDLALRDDQDLAYPIEDIYELATDPSLTFQESKSMDIDKHYEVDRILKRWNKNLFLLRWLEDGSYWWVHRKDINADLIQKKVLATRKRHGKIEYRIRWLGRPEGEDTWVQERQMSPELVEKHKPKKAASKRRKRC
ncbi:hypothetical protein F5Y16DRAFT_410969 [Xylariaceae sp. FL0255]|nr:hypothetical protein F5Y16DRAFT_410969 [Xylariaceae sp. FL0255]